MTTAKPTVVEALSRVMGDVQAVGKKDRNSQQGYDFRGVDAVVNAVGPVLRQHGVVVVPAKSEARYRDVQTNSGKPSRECTVTVTYRFYGPAGDFIDCEVPGESMDFGDKGAPKAMSVAYRIALLQALCIPTHEPEPDSQTYERGKVEAPPEPVTQAQHKRMAVLWRELGFGGESNRDNRLRITAKIIGMEELVTSAALSTEQAARVIAALEERKRVMDQQKEVASALPDNTDPA